MTLTLTVSNVINPTELTAPPLADFPEFQRLFSVIEPNPPTLDPATSRVVFPYRMRPRDEGKFQIPELKYVFARRAGSPKQFRLDPAHAESVPFIVTKPVVPKAEVRPLDGPPEFFELRGGFARSGGPEATWWVGLFAGFGLIGVGWVAGWRRMYPDAARLARIRRNRAARVTLDRLRSAVKSPDPTAATAAAFRGYLTARHGIPFAAQTPQEVADSLRAVEFPADRVIDAEAILRGFDAVRYGGSTEQAASPTAVAALIERWEGVR
jgi:hypothetical protein